jgi:general secretion pathway protein B
MSLILDALRKMEQDRKSREAAAQQMRSQVLRYRAPVAPQQGKPYLLLTVGALLVLTGIGAGILLKGHLQPPQSEIAAGAAPTLAPTSAPPALSAVPPVTVAAAQAVPAPGAVSPPAAAAPPTIAVPVTPAAPSAAIPVSSAKKLKGHPAVAPPAPTIATAVTSPDAGAHPSTQPQSSKRSRRAAAKNGGGAPVPAQATAARSEVVQGAAPDISVSGIAWQDERHLRRAVLNGTLIGEGGEVAGARVVEIKENRVRLSRGGQLFDVPLTSGFGR